MLGFGDLSLLVKAGVQWGLFGGAVLHLGTHRHHERYLADIVSGKLLGCFAMTETGHGSDVAHVRTTATLRPAVRRVRRATPPTMTPARSTSATPRATVGWPRSSPS